MLLAAARALAQACGAIGSPYGISGCVVPGRYGNPSVRIKADPINPVGIDSYPVTTSPIYHANLPRG